MNFVAADVRRLIFFGTAVKASYSENRLRWKRVPAMSWIAQSAGRDAGAPGFSYSVEERSSWGLTSAATILELTLPV
jgi:hypothetical protein